MERKFLPSDVQVGQPLQAQTEEGVQPITVWVAELTDEHAVIDANHPLSGRNLSFEIEVVSIRA